MSAPSFITGSETGASSGSGVYVLVSLDAGRMYLSPADTMRASSESEGSERTNSCRQATTSQKCTLWAGVDSTTTICAVMKEVSQVVNKQDQPIQ
jgi:hypothetical protein